jgi:PAS domain S-box-containing protein
LGDLCQLGGWRGAATRLPGGTLIFLITDGFRPGVLRQYDASPDGQLGHLRQSGAVSDPRQMAWYKPAKDTHGRYWSAPYRGSSDLVFRVSLSAPVFDAGGSFAGVVGTGLLLSDIARDIQPLHAIGRQERSFIIDSAGQLVASSGGVMSVVRGPDGGEQRVLAADSNDPVVRGIARYLQTRPDILGRLRGGGTTAFSFEDPVLGEVYAAVMRFQAFGGFGWTAVTAIPASDFLAPTRYAFMFSIALSVFVVALALALGNWIVVRTLRPLTALTQAARSITRGEWPDIPEVHQNDEIGVLGHAFKRMTASLKETQEGLRQSEENYRSIVENALEGIIRISHDGRVITANPALARMLGYASPEEMIAAKTVEAELVLATTHARDVEHSTVPSRDAITGYEAELHGKDGRSIWVLLSSRLVRDASGEPVYTETFITDITERKGAEQALHDAREDLARVARVTTMGGLTATIAHEVNQPLTGVVNGGHACLRWLAGDTPNIETARRSVERMINDGERAGQVISRIRAMVVKSPSRRDWLNVNDVIMEVVTLTRNEVDRYRVTLITDLCEDLPCVKGDRIQLQQVILNLIMNAIEAMSAVREGARELLVSSASNESETVLVTVRDSGKGLDPEQLSRIFDAFYTTKTTGMGLGLAISRSIVEAHGGRLWASANVPQGAAFRLTLPVERVEEASVVNSVTG